MMLCIVPSRLQTDASPVNLCWLIAELGGHQLLGLTRHHWFAQNPSWLAFLCPYAQVLDTHEQMKQALEVHSQLVAGCHLGRLALR